MTIVLDSQLEASSHDEILPEHYRAVLTQTDDGDIIYIEQPIDGKWHPTPGGWYADTLLKQPSDSISIDYGARRSIESGMLRVLDSYLKLKEAA